MTKIARALKSTPGARENLILHYKEQEWLDVTENPVDGELVTLALVRIKQDPSQFDLFMKMLCGINGMDLIVATLTGGELSYTVYTHYIYYCLSKYLNFNPNEGTLRLLLIAGTNFSEFSKNK